ncbi:MAG: 2-amino-4-hydroxy-6-hydroxymethyldihydropteridine diphosphokinase [Calditrichaeota bacterium]|nr:2-amino-4-hydroxy-6-hydroxymethyldihydropteridine diphosphokinase [Calditrichota bacterium]
MGAAGIFLGLGTNLGDRERNLIHCLKELTVTDQVEICRISSVYETAPVGVTDQPDFLNMVVEIETSLLPWQLLHFVKKVEKKIGRKNGRRWGPRLIDVDILAYRDVVLEANELKIPHARLAERLFVLIPLQEIAPDFFHPQLNVSVAELIQQCQDIKQVRIY